MSLGTILASALTLPGMPAEPSRPRTALVLMGGGARTAYQAGVLLGIDRILGRTPRNRYDLLVGTSAGALNAAFLAAHADLGSDASARMAEFWQQVRSHDVYRTAALPWAAPMRWATLLSAGWTLRRQARSLLDNAPLAGTLRRGIPTDRIARNLLTGHLQGLAVTASSYTTGMHWTFCQLADPRHRQPWQRPGRQASLESITVRHLMASAAIPFIFPAVPLHVGSGAQLHTEFFGDGSMRQIAPLSPARHLGPPTSWPSVCPSPSGPASARPAPRCWPLRCASRRWPRSPATRWPASSTTPWRRTSSRRCGSTPRSPA